MKKFLIIGGAIAGFVIAALLFTFAPNWLQGDAATAQEVGGDSSGERQMIIAVEEVKVIDGVETVTAGEVVINFENPEELPDTAAAADGIFKSQDGDTIMVGTGSINVEIEVEQINDQEPVMAVAASHSGPELEVLLTDDTQIYFETTAEPKPTQADLDAGEMTLPRSIEPGSLDQLGEDKMVQVWGPRDGDTITAEVLVITPIQ